MTKYILQNSNKTLPIYFENAFETLIIQKLDLELNVIDGLNYNEKIVVIGSLLGSFVVGSYFVYPLYHYMYDHRKELLIWNKDFNPISVLLILQAIIQHFACFYLLVLILTCKTNFWRTFTWATSISCLLQLYNKVAGLILSNFKTNPLIYVNAEQVPTAC